MKKRIAWLDFARGISIIFVVLGHSVDSIYYSTKLDPIVFKFLLAILFTVSMPCFFSISGYLYRPITNLHSYLLMVYKKAISLGMPYIIFSFMYVFLQNFGGNNVHQLNSYGSLLYIYKDPISYMWFLYSLFLMFIIIGLLDLINVNLCIQFFIYLFMMIISIKYKNLLPSGINSMCNNILYFYIGSLLSRKKYSYISYKFLQFKSTIFILISIFIILFINQSIYISGGMTNNSTFSDFLTKVVSILLLVNLSLTISRKKIFRYFNRCGKNTLIIYLIHWPAICIIRVLLLKLFPINDYIVIFIFIFVSFLAWYVSVFVCFLSNRFTIVNFIFYPRKQYISKFLIRTKVGHWLFND